MIERRWVATVSVAAGVLVLVHAVTWDVVRFHDGEFVARSADIVTVGAGRAGLFRVSLILDMLGSYLLLLPAAAFLWHTLRERSRLAADVATGAALVYVGAGAAAAAALAAGGEPLIKAYAVASTADQHAIAVAFTALMGSAEGIWQTLVTTAGGVWWITVGWTVRQRWRGLGVFSLVLGAFALAVAVGRAAGVTIEPRRPVAPAFASVGVWAAWTGIMVWRDGAAPVGRNQP